MSDLFSSLFKPMPRQSKITNPGDALIFCRKKGPAYEEEFMLIKLEYDGTVTISYTDRYRLENSDGASEVSLQRVARAIDI